MVMANYRFRKHDSEHSNAIFFGQNFAMFDDKIERCVRNSF